ncbi:hypothetical protein KKE06_00545, partial [Candidatus Micrarchaeota archaeon]|nr:hypothetical protein [Candidatus Micrarchaeota archaeon]
MKSAITVLKHQKRGQSALEYLMSYGWAMVVVAVIVASLVILIEPGMVSTGNVSGFNQGIVLLNSAVPSSASESLQLVFVNQTGRQLHAMNLDVTDSTGAPVNGTASASSGGTWEGTGTFKIGAKETITFEPDSDWSGKSFTITVSYTDPDNFTRTAHGTMNTSFGSTGTPTNCGNGGVDPDEDCDGSDFDGETCNSLGAGSYGSLVCTGSCTINTSACHNCGNGIQEGSEQCDGSDFPLDAGCENYEVVPGEYFAPGKNATCSGVCMINTSTCSLCGNGGINGLEECDPGPPEELGGL